MTQPASQPVPMDLQLIMFYAKDQQLLKEFEKVQTDEFLKGLAAYVEKNDSTLRALICEKRDLTDEIKRRMTAVVKSFVAEILAKVPEDAEAA